MYGFSIICDCKQKLMKICQNETEICENAKREASRKLHKTQQEIDRSFKQFHECLDNGMRLINEESHYAKSSKKEEGTLIKLKKTLYQCKETKKELTAAVTEYREYESLNK